MSNDTPPTPPAGHVLLGRGNTFKTDGYFSGFAHHCDEGWISDDEWTGNCTRYWYAAPIDSLVAYLNDLGPKLAPPAPCPDPITLLEAKNKEITHLNKVLARKNRKIKSLNAALRERGTAAAPVTRRGVRYVRTTNPGDRRVWRISEDKVEINWFEGHSGHWEECPRLHRNDFFTHPSYDNVGLGLTLVPAP